ncbi:MAG: hypothetical protein ABIP49_00810 [Lysobacterales bacterium]
MASQRWQHLVVEVKPRVFGNMREQLQAELDKHGAAGWELVTALQPNPLLPARLLFKRQP